MIFLSKSDKLKVINLSIEVYKDLNIFIEKIKIDVLDKEKVVERNLKYTLLITGVSILLSLIVISIWNYTPMDSCTNFGNCITPDGYITGFGVIIALLGIGTAVLLNNDQIKKQNFNYTKSLFLNKEGVYRLNFLSLLGYATSNEKNKEILKSNELIDPLSDYYKNHGMIFNGFVEEFGKEKILMYEPVQIKFNIIEMKFHTLNKFIKQVFHDINDEPNLLPLTYMSKNDLKRLIELEVEKCKVLLKEIYKDLNLKTPDFLEEIEYSQKCLLKILNEYNIR